MESLDDLRAAADPWSRRVAALPSRDELPFRRLEAAVRGLQAARLAVGAAEQEFAAAVAQCRATLGLIVSLETFAEPGDPPLMPVEP